MVAPHGSDDVRLLLGDDDLVAALKDDACGHSFLLSRELGWVSGRRDLARLIELLDAGGYARYDLRTAERLHAIAHSLAAYDGRVSSLLGRPPQELAAALRALPGWGPVTVGLFLRELRGVRPGIEPPIDPRALGSAEHLGLLKRDGADPLSRLRRVARDAHLDLRDLESALVRLSLAHRRGLGQCPGGERCALLAP
ncbi:MAG: hypothetical protein ACHQAV_07375 [Solirubrobacterales bacterium]